MVLIWAGQRDKRMTWMVQERVWRTCSFFVFITRTDMWIIRIDVENLRAFPYIEKMMVVIFVWKQVFFCTKCVFFQGEKVWLPKVRLAQLQKKCWKTCLRTLFRNARMDACCILSPMFSVIYQGKRGGTARSTAQRSWVYLFMARLYASIYRIISICTPVRHIQYAVLFRLLENEVENQSLAKKLTRFFRMRESFWFIHIKRWYLSKHNCYIFVLKQ